MAEEQAEKRNSEEPRDTGVPTDAVEEYDDEFADSPDEESLEDHLRLLERVILLLLCLGLAVSVCLNIFFLHQNTSLRRAFDQARFETEQADNITRFNNIMISELRQLASTNKNAQELLVKYQYLIGGAPPPGPGESEPPPPPLDGPPVE